jgi:hypothetical protein
VKPAIRLLYWPKQTQSMLYTNIHTHKHSPSEFIAPLLCRRTHPHFVLTLEHSTGNSVKRAVNKITFNTFRTAKTFTRYQHKGGDTHTKECSAIGTIEWSDSLHLARTCADWLLLTNLPSFVCADTSHNLGATWLYHIVRLLSKQDTIKQNINLILIHDYVGAWT